MSPAQERAVREVLSAITLRDECLLVPREMTLEAIGVDSAAMIELLFALEDRFSIQIGEHEIAPENFASIETLTALVARKCP
jgi:acyl carrier protein